MDFATSTTFLFFLLLLPFSAVAQTDDGRNDVGSSLTATNDGGSPWLSPSGDFAFGFHPHAGLFLVSIWFDKVPNKTLVWYAFENGSPILAHAGSKIELTAENGLVLLNPRGDQLWKSDIATDEASYCVMNDTGNFVVRSRNSDVLWQSFDHPTDTLLPTQILGINGKLFSRQNENNFSQGRFQLSLQTDGNLVLSMVNLPTKLVYEGPFYTSDTNDAANESNSGFQLIFNGSGDVYVLRRNRRTSYVRTGVRVALPTADFYQRMTLDFDGVFAQYYYPKRSTSVENWTTVWSKPDNICNRMGDRGSGACGFNSICRLNENGRPTCRCPPGFSLLDPEDKYGSCKPEVELDCREDERIPMEDLYGITVILNTDWPGLINDYEKLHPYNEQDCETACLRDCMCAAAIWKDDNCWKKKLPLTNGRVDDRFTGKALIKITKGDRTRRPSLNLPNADEVKNKGTLIAVSTLLGTSMFLNFALVGAFCLGFFSIYKKKLSKVQEIGLELNNLQVFTYKQLAEATNGFREELGRGAFGIVYKGKIEMRTVAVKKLDRLVRDENLDKEFKTEINIIGQTHHKNLVRLLGFCQEKEQRLLVYEYLSNGTLADYLFKNTKPSWNQRTQIAKSIASGLLYLHEECSKQIIHCDIKPQNILLDDNYDARISDFGLSKLLMMNQTQTKTDIRGTKGYVAPEWFRNMPVTAKVDVYSFGVLLLEIICCRRSVGVEENAADFDGDSSVLTYWAYDCFHGGTIDALVGDDMEAINDRTSLERFLMTALWCIQEDPYLRPTMKKVTQMLGGVVQVTVPPDPSPFTTAAESSSLNISCI
ncbi:hypothetical protein F3Y22_tig00112114pilonHSYRG00003 [Hibiscus syriacus]|uniref:Receptor-like serine/threonine-protein kinase n=1 Tax=Hibiscus syriacus TaxID=106335 RepID=A0A6A2X699_HIBSY|nr:G-type lectin S-receptor-like serine/threonine-protein kinase LECRK1 [Hibiscus syriacus]KAE8670602.1 hypothetical protein F3Y22_tig00112114pilonHSYRG00003 [Hibiscus syriacus]